MRLSLILIVITIGSLAISAHPSGQTVPVRVDFGLPAESVGWDDVLNGLLSAFERADVLALGEAHGRAVDSELRIRLIRHPDFANRVRFIVVEFGTVAMQSLIDRFVNGEDAPDPAKLWSSSVTQKDFYEAVRAVNRVLPARSRIRVLGVGLPNAEASNAAALAAIRSEVLAKREKALVVYGAGHTWHQEGGITNALDAEIPGRVFAAESFAPLSAPRGPAMDAFNVALKAFDQEVRSTERPVLVSLRRSPAARRIANPFFLGQAMLPPTTTLGDLDDAIVYFGTP